ncbi:MAG: class I SAM-dependent RNA methyltransferase [Firmicutes bacterium]|jgi:putative N6-adenine-specific DNA methylase|nr:class I SAM-dependent RNA methyltransferase [Bacillota bacterium]
MQNIELIAASTFGLEALVAQELRDLGYHDLMVENGRITFTADPEAICRSNLWLRTADRVKIKIGEFKATTFDELFDQTKALPWADWIPENAKFPVDGKSVKSELFSVSDCQAIVKKAVVESLRERYHRDWFPEDGPLYKIEVALLKDIATLSIDTTGPGLHKRGYRTLVGQAPLKETLAAAMIMLARWYHDIALIDPFCGSGTIPIEAALMGLNIAPGLNRSFASEDWPNIPKQLWDEARQEARELAQFDRSLYIIGTDIDPQVLKAARHNAEAAGLSELIHFQASPLQDLSSKRKYGKIICNPPYGERIGERKEVAKLYREMGQVFSKLDTWSFYVLTSNPDFERLFGRPATKKRKLYSGNMKVDYYQYFGPRPPKRRQE